MYDMHIQYLEVLILGRNLDPFLCNGAQVCSSPAVLCMDLFFSLFVSTFAGFIGNQETQCVRFGGHAPSPHRSHCLVKRRLHGTLYMEHLTPHRRFLASAKRLLKYAPALDTDLVPPKPCRDRRNKVGEGTPQKKIRGENPCKLAHRRFHGSRAKRQASGHCRF